MNPTDYLPDYLDEELIEDDRAPGLRKYGERKTEMDGITFDSAAEARRYRELLLVQSAGEITDLKVQPEWVLQPSFKHGKRTIRAIKYRADFSYTEVSTGELVVEDVKGIETAVFQIKAKMLLYVHNIEVRRVRMSARRKRS